MTKRQLRTIKVTVKVNCILCFKNFYLLLQNNFLHYYSTNATYDKFYDLTPS